MLKLNLVPVDELEAVEAPTIKSCGEPNGSVSHSQRAYRLNIVFLCLSKRVAFSAVPRQPEARQFSIGAALVTAARETFDFTQVRLRQLNCLALDHADRHACSSADLYGPTVSIVQL